METPFWGALCASCFLMSGAALAGSFGVLESVEFKQPNHDGMTQWSVAEPTEITTNLTNGYTGPLRVDFEFEYASEGTVLDTAFILPKKTDGIAVDCFNDKHPTTYSQSNPTVYGHCIIDSNWVDAIDEPVELVFGFLGGGGTDDGVEDLTWQINPFAGPLKVETIAVRQPVEQGGHLRIRYTLNMPAESNNTKMKVGFAPYNCFAPTEERLMLTSNRAPRDPNYLFDELIFNDGDLATVKPIQTKTCNSRSFSISVWADANINNFSADTYTARDIDFFFPK